MGCSRKLSFHNAQWHLLIFCTNTWGFQLYHPVPCSSFFRSVTINNSAHFPENNLQELDRFPPHPYISAGPHVCKEKVTHFQVATAVRTDSAFSPFLQQKLMRASTVQGAWEKIQRPGGARCGGRDRVAGCAGWFLCHEFPLGKYLLYSYMFRYWFWCKPCPRWV